MKIDEGNITRPVLLVGYSFKTERCVILDPANEVAATPKCVMGKSQTQLLRGAYLLKSAMTADNCIITSAGLFSLQNLESLLAGFQAGYPSCISEQSLQYVQLKRRKDHGDYSPYMS